jgi:nucleoside-diphosphate-sugar epimerase
MHLLILGGNSFIGSRLANYFSKTTHWIIEKLGSSDLDLCQSSCISILRKKITDKTAIIFCSTISRLQDDSIIAFQKNIAMATHVAMALISTQYQNLIFLSSIDIYGRPPTERHITEKSKINPFGYYGLAKFASERILKHELGNDNKLAILRLPGVFSLDESDPSVLGLIFSHLKNNRSVTLSGSGNQIRSYLNITELCLFVESILSNSWTGTINLGSNIGTLIEFSLTMKNFIKSNSKIIYSDKNGTEFNIIIDNTAQKEFSHIKQIKFLEYLEKYISL